MMPDCFHEIRTHIVSEALDYFSALNTELWFHLSVKCNKKNQSIDFLIQYTIRCIFIGICTVNGTMYLDFSSFVSVTV